MVEVGLRLDERWSILEIIWGLRTVWGMAVGFRNEMWFM